MKLFVDKKEKKVHNTLNFKFATKVMIGTESKSEVEESRWLVEIGTEPCGVNHP